MADDWQPEATDAGAGAPSPAHKLHPAFLLLWIMGIGHCAMSWRLPADPGGYVVHVGDPLHLLFDLLAYATAAITLQLCVRHFSVPASPISAGFGLFYLVVASTGAVIGGYALATLNTVLSGMEATLAKSVLGALLGGIAAIELMKWRYQLKGSTGALLVLSIALGIVVGRIGCYLSGLRDYAYGTATSLPLGVDFGDGILRHPVQLYEALALLLLALAYLGLLSVRRHAVLDQSESSATESL